jgi:AAA domain
VSAPPRPFEADLIDAYLRRDGKPEPVREANDSVEAIRRAILDDGQEVGRSGQELREPIPGTNDLLKRAAAHMIFGSRESGKTFVMLLVAIAAANAGERVLYLDLENGEPEMRERLEAILDATGWPNPLESGALRIVSYPTLSRSWKPEDWAEAMSAWTVVVVDPLRDVLEAHGLEEKDGFAALVGTRIAPLRARGITVVVGANVGHEHKERPRGDSRQEDALPQVYKCVLVEEFNHVLVGRVRLACRRSRYGDTGREWEARVGGEVFELPATTSKSPKQRAAEKVAEKERNFRRAVADALREESPLGINRLLQEVRRRRVKVEQKKARSWLSAMVADPTTELVKGDDGYSLRGVTLGGDAPHDGRGDAALRNNDVAAAADTPREGPCEDPKACVVSTVLTARGWHCEGCGEYVLPEPGRARQRRPEGTT